MAKTERARHALRRTSPFGERFVGMCILCGEMNLTTGDMESPCPNPDDIPEDAALLTLLATEEE